MCTHIIANAEFDQALPTRTLANREPHGPVGARVLIERDRVRVNLLGHMADVCRDLSDISGLHKTKLRGHARSLNAADLTQRTKQTTLVGRYGSTKPRGTRCAGTTSLSPPSNTSRAREPIGKTEFKSARQSHAACDNSRGLNDSHHGRSHGVREVAPARNEGSEIARRCLVDGPRVFPIRSVMNLSLGPAGSLEWSMSSSQIRLPGDSPGQIRLRLDTR